MQPPTKSEDSLKLAIICSHYGAESLGQAQISWGGRVPVFLQDGKDGMLPAYQRGFEATEARKVITTEGLDDGHEFEYLAYLHDDVLLNDSTWPERVLAEFEDPAVGLVGFGGALGHGTSGLYRDPYDYKQLAREDFLSNMVDAENHGKRFTGSCEVAVLDGFALIVRREVLEKAGGWNAAIELLSNGNVNEPLHHCYDYWLSCITRRLGYRVRLVGVSCEHKGGSTYVKLGTGKRESNWFQFLEAHRQIYDHFRDVLPARVNQ